MELTGRTKKVIALSFADAGAAKEVTDCLESYTEGEGGAGGALPQPLAPTDDPTFDHVHLGAGGVEVEGNQVLGVQHPAIAHLTITAISGDMPWADGAVAIADASMPTVEELLEFCVEVAAKQESLIFAMTQHGLIAPPAEKQAEIVHKRSHHKHKD